MGSPLPGARAPGVAFITSARLEASAVPSGTWKQTEPSLELTKAEPASVSHA